MDKNLIEHIVSDLRLLGKNVVLVENPDGFLLREDVIQKLLENSIIVSSAKQIQQRIDFELRNKDNYYEILLLISDSSSNYLEDIQKASVKTVFHLSSYIDGYHLKTILDYDLVLLNKLYAEKQIISLSKKETQEFTNTLHSKVNLIQEFDTTSFQKTVDELTSEMKKNWYEIIKSISDAIRLTIGTENYIEVTEIINSVNKLFQKELLIDYEQAINSNPIKKPKIVSKILDHLSFCSLDDKLALIVIDGMSFWQYQMFSSKFPSNFNFTEDYIYSYLPSITQLSRQAIFRGETPLKDYAQNPRSEEKLWKSYWERKGIHKSEIRYNHENINLYNLERISKFALVFTDLDEKMHSSTDYADLMKLTENWIKRTNIINTISQLTTSGFDVYITTDHGNIEAKGWRRLKDREKLGTNKSGSKSQRHIEYSENSLVAKFLESNEEILKSLVKKDNVLYFKDNLSFSTKEHLVTHGGSHILEVVIPFIKIVK